MQTKVLVVLSLICFICFFSLMIAYHTESRSALAEQLRAIAQSDDVSGDVKNSMIKESSRLSGLAVAASFFGIFFGATFIGAVYLRWFGKPPSISYRHIDRLSDRVVDLSEKASSKVEKMVGGGGGRKEKSAEMVDFDSLSVSSRTRSRSPATTTRR